MALPGWWHPGSLARMVALGLAVPGWHWDGLAEMPPGLTSPGQHFDWSHWDGGTGMASPYGGTRIRLAGMALELALLGLASLGQHQDGLTGTGLSKTLLGLVLPGLASLGQRWIGLTGTVAPGQPWDGLATRALGLALLG